MYQISNMLPNRFLSLLFIVFFSMLHINANAQAGSNDTTFDIGTGFDNSVFSTSLLPDEKIIAGGYFFNI